MQVWKNLYITVFEEKWGKKIIQATWPRDFRTVFGERTHCMATNRFLSKVWVYHLPRWITSQTKVMDYTQSLWIHREKHLVESPSENSFQKSCRVGRMVRTEGEAGRLPGWGALTSLSPGHWDVTLVGIKWQRQSSDNTHHWLLPPFQSKKV